MKSSVFASPVGVLIFAFVKLTVASPFLIPDSLRAVSETGKIVLDSKFQGAQQQLISSSSNPDDFVASKAIEILKGIGHSVNFTGVTSLAQEIAIEGIVEAIRLVVTMEHAAKTALSKALELIKSEQTEAALGVLNKGLKFDRKLIFLAGVPVHQAQGTALALLGGGAFEGFNNAVVNVQRAGCAILGAVELAGEISSLGIKAGGAAAESSIRAARQTITAGVIAVIETLSESARNVVEQLRKISSIILAQENKAVSIVNSFTTGLSTDNPQALLAIDRLNRSFDSTLLKLSNQTTIDACKVMHQGVLATILMTAEAIAEVKKSLAVAAKLVRINPEVAEAIIRKAIKTAEEQVLNGSGPGFLAVGAAGQMTNKEAEQKLIPVMVEVEYGRVSVFEELTLAERAALVGLWNGEVAALEGIEAAIETCDAAGSILYQDYADAGEMGFDALLG